MAGIEIVPFDPDAPNAKVLNALRFEATDVYRNRIPVATQANYETVLEKLSTYTPAYNEFVSAFVNKIGLQISKNTSWTNPFAKFKRGILPFGSTIEEYQTGLLNAYVFDPDRDYGEKALFAKERPEVQTSYHTINRQDMYKFSVQRPMLQRAFLTEGGLMGFINDLMEMPTKSDNWDEFILMTRLFAEYEQNGGFFHVLIPDISASDSTQDMARKGLRSIREYAAKLPFISRHYNAAGMPVSADPGDLELFTTPGFQAAIDVEALAALFNVPYAEVPSRITVIPEENMNIPGVQAILTTKDFFVVADTYYDTAQIDNPAGLHTNFFLHHHQIISFSRFVPAIAFSDTMADSITLTEYDITEITGVTIKDWTGTTVTEVERGRSYEIVVTGSVTGGPLASDVTLTGAESSHSYVTPSTLHVAADESATSVTVTVAGLDSAATDSVTLSVVGDRMVLWPNPRVMNDSDLDGLYEVTPVEPTRTGNVIHIPTVEGVEYSVEGVAVPDGSDQTIAVSSTVTAAARTGYELTTGAVASWEFAPV